MDHFSLLLSAYYFFLVSDNFFLVLLCCSLSSVGSSCLKDTRPFSDRLYREKMVRELVQVSALISELVAKKTRYT